MTWEIGNVGIETALLDSEIISEFPDPYFFKVREVRKKKLRVAYDPYYCGGSAAKDGFARKTYSIGKNKATKLRKK